MLRLMFRYVPTLWLTTVLLATAPAFAQTSSGLTQEMEWRAEEGAVRQLAVEKSGTLYALDADGHALKLLNSPRRRWFSLGETFARLSARPDRRGIWALKPETGQAFRYNRSFWAEKGTLAFKDITITEKGVVLGLSHDNGLLEWHDRTEHWETVLAGIDADVVRLVAGSGNNVWLVDAGGRLTTLDSRGGVTPAGADGIIDIAYDPITGSLLLVDDKERLWRRDDASGRLTELTGAEGIRSVAAGLDGMVWIVNASGQVLSGRKKLPVKEIARDEVPIVDPAISGTDAAVKATAADTQAGQQAASDGETEAAAFKLDLFKVPGFKTKRIEIGDDGRVIAMPSDAKVYMWNNGRQEFHLFPGTAARAAVAPDGEIWSVSLAGDVSYFDGTQWQYTSFENGRDIWVSPEGTVWVSNSDEEIYVYDRRRKRFDRQKKLSGSYFTFDAKGRFWTARADGAIYVCEDKRCKRVPGTAQDIVTGHHQHVMHIDPQGRLYLYVEPHNRWELIRKDVHAIAFGPNDMPWLVDKNETIWASAFFKRDERNDYKLAAAAIAIAERNARLTTSSASKSKTFTFTKNLDWETVDVEGTLLPRVLSVGPNGAAFAIDSTFSSVWEYNSSKDEFKLMNDLPLSGTTVRRIAVSSDGYLWILYSTNRIFRPDGEGKWKEITSFSSASFVDGNYNDQIFAVDTSNNMYEYNDGKGKFEQFDDATGEGAGDFSLDPDGHPWIRVDATGYLREYTGKKFEFRPTDQSQKIDNVGIGGTGEVYVSEETGSAGRLLKWNSSNKDFDEVSVPSGVKVLWVDVSGDGRPWFISTANIIYRAK